MLKIVNMRIVQFYEMCNEKGPVSTLKEMICLNREVIPLEIDLTNLKPRVSHGTGSDILLINITRDTLHKISPIYRVKNRYYKALLNTSKGYEAYALVRGKEVLGDLWYFTFRNSGPKSMHPDLKLLNIDLRENEVYGFDMYVKPEQRGRLAVSLLMGALNELKERGFSKFYAYVMADNVPALWLHRMLKFNELHRMKMLRFLSKRRLRALSTFA